MSTTLLDLMDRCDNCGTREAPLVRCFGREVCASCAYIIESDAARYEIDTVRALLAITHTEEQWAGQSGR